MLESLDLDIGTMDTHRDVVWHVDFHQWISSKYIIWEGSIWWVEYYDLGNHQIWQEWYFECIMGVYVCSAWHCHVVNYHTPSIGLV